MGSKSNSATSSTNITKDFTFNNVDNRVADEGGDIEGNLNFNVGEGGLSGNILNLVRTDHGAVENALAAADSTSRAGFDFAGDTTRAGFDFAGEAIDDLRGFGSDAIDSVDRTTRAGFDFAGEAIDDLRGFGSDAIDSVDRTTRAGFDFAGDALDKSIDTVSEFGLGAVKAVEDNSTRALNAFGELLDDNLAHLSTSQSNALTAINRATRSESALVLENITKTGGFALVAIVAGFVLISKFSR